MFIEGKDDFFDVYFILPFMLRDQRKHFIRTSLSTTCTNLKTDTFNQIRHN